MNRVAKESQSQDSLSDTELSSEGTPLSEEPSMLPCDDHRSSSFGFQPGLKELGPEAQLEREREHDQASWSHRPLRRVPDRADLARQLFLQSSSLP